MDSLSIKNQLSVIHKIIKHWRILLACILLFVLGFIDYYSGYEIAFSIFYLFPIVLVAWYEHIYSAYLVSFLAAAIWLIADLTSGHVYSHIVIPFWNSTMRLGFFLIFSFFISKIRKLLDHEKELSQVDMLTGIANSRFFYTQLEFEIKKAVRYKRCLTLAYIDLDNFKQVNDTLGHLAGDDLLRASAGLIKSNIRSVDIFARLGGDEFSIIFSETDDKQARVVVDKLYNILSSSMKQNNLPVTFSIGVVTFKNLVVFNTDEYMKKADNEMYLAKKRGKNRVNYAIVDMEKHIQQ